VVRYGRSKNFKVSQGYRNWYQSKARVQFPISLPL